MAEKKNQKEINHNDLVSMTAESTGNSEAIVDNCVTGYADNMAKAVTQVFDDNPDVNSVNVFTPLGGYMVDKVTTANGEERTITPMIATNFFDEVNAGDVRIKALKDGKDKSETA